jgi:hypothetical protein
MKDLYLSTMSIPPPPRTKQGAFHLAFQKQGSKQLYHPLWKDVERCPKMSKDEERRKEITKDDSF